jgi:hypothetical protein
VALHVIISLDNPVSLRDLRTFVYLTESKAGVDEDLRYLNDETGQAESLEVTFSDSDATVHLHKDILDLRKDGRTFCRDVTGDSESEASPPAGSGLVHHE